MTLERALEILSNSETRVNINEPNEAIHIACNALAEKIERENPKPIPYKNLKNFVHRPIFIVDGNVRCWTILVSVNDDFAHFVESEDCGVRLMSEGCGITWFAYEHEPI